MRRLGQCIYGAALHSALLLPHRPAYCQELEPRAYAANPINIGFVIAAFGYSSGGVLLDPTAPVSDVSAKLQSVMLGGGGTFALFGRTTSVSVAVPYAWGSISGTVGEGSRSIERSGLADARLRFSINLLGGPALPLAAFTERKPGTIMGTSLTISVPTGEYLPDKLINLGTNRWGFKPEVGVSHPTGHWTLELSTGCWVFTRNASYFGGHTLDVRPLMSVQSHVAYTFKPRLWLAADATFYAGGRSVVDGQPASERQENTRVGLTLSLPVLRTNSIKAAWSTGASVRLGGNFDTITLAWQSTLGGRPARRAP
jgi:Putative MetA-pathway of phenol degradation